MYIFSRQQAGDDLELYQILLACQKQFLETHVVLWTVISDMIIIITTKYHYIRKTITVLVMGQ